MSTDTYDVELVVQWNRPFTYRDQFKVYSARVALSLQLSGFRNIEFRRPHRGELKLLVSGTAVAQLAVEARSEKEALARARTRFKGAVNRVRMCRRPDLTFL